MDIQDLKEFYQIPPANQPRPQEGMLLIAEPFMHDYVFRHSVILLISISDKDVLGLRLDLPPFYDRGLGQIVPEFAHIDSLEQNIYNGGPVGKDTLFFLHTYGDLKNASPVLPGLWVNGDFEQMKQKMLTDPNPNAHSRFFLGYSCWTPAQLRNEIERAHSWILGGTDVQHALEYEENMWASTLTRMGRKYEICTLFTRIPLYN